MIFRVLFLALAVQVYAPIGKCFNCNNDVMFFSQESLTDCKVCHNLVERSTTPLTVEDEVERVKRELGISFDSNNNVLYYGHVQDPESVALLAHVTRSHPASKPIEREYKKMTAQYAAVSIRQAEARNEESTRKLLALSQAVKRDMETRGQEPKLREVTGEDWDALEREMAELGEKVGASDSSAKVE